MTKELLKMAERDGCKTVMEVTLWFKGYLQCRLDDLENGLKEMKKGDDNEKDIEN